eukprot:TRINITY_DN1345_c0_g1_i3.p1 TRINITY_DN1345_c0_g1~~TRINITY_DN1345_c0_g1_i3.p1  ORF type:complete len:456 (+),score=176.16 TRINITY_DN1345_c0_g1_i3:183-1550(+)
MCIRDRYQRRVRGSSASLRMEEEEEVEERIQAAELKLKLGIQNMRNIEEAEVVLLRERGKLLRRLEERVRSKGHMEQFVSDQISERNETMIFLQNKIETMHHQALKEKQLFEQRKAECLGGNKKKLYLLESQMNKREELLLEVRSTRMEKDTLTRNLERIHDQLDMTKKIAAKCFRDLEQNSKKEISRLMRKESVKNQGLIRAFKEQQLTLRQQSGTKAAADNVSKRVELLKKGHVTVNVLERNSKLEREHQELVRELETHRYNVEELRIQHDKLRKQLMTVTEQYWESEDSLAKKQQEHEGRAVNQDLPNANALLTDYQAEAKQCRDRLREAIQECKELKLEDPKVRQELLDHQKDSLSWAITSALPTICSRERSEQQSDGGVQRREQELELLLSALRVALIRDEFNQALEITKQDAKSAVKQSPRIAKVSSASTYVMSTSGLLDTYPTPIPPP